jgi:hypothetical protein
VKTVGIVTDAYDPEASVVFAYDPELVDIIRSAPRRRWDKRGRRWLIPAAHTHFVADLFHAAGVLVLIDGEHYPPPAPPVRPASNPVANLLDALPEHLRRPALRALARVLHPDTGGDTDAMRLLTDALNRRGKL